MDDKKEMEDNDLRYVYNKLSEKVYILFKSQTKIILFFVLFNLSVVSCNRPPRFLIDGQTEIVLRLKEGKDNPVGKLEFA